MTDSLTQVGGNAAGSLKSFISRIENLTGEKKSVQDDIKQVFDEAKVSGFDTKIMRIVLRRRAMEKAARDEQDALVDTYSVALGMAVEDDEEGDTHSDD